MTFISINEKENDLRLAVFKNKKIKILINQNKNVKIILLFI
jgi:hypothetical protein